jgi:hypothetical protein
MLHGSFDGGGSYVDAAAGPDGAGLDVFAVVERCCYRAGAVMAHMCTWFPCPVCSPNNWAMPAGLPAEVECLRAEVARLRAQRDYYRRRWLVRGIRWPEWCWPPPGLKEHYAKTVRDDDLSGPPR